MGRSGKILGSEGSWNDIKCMRVIEQLLTAVKGSSKTKQPFAQNIPYSVAEKGLTRCNVPNG